MPAPGGHPLNVARADNAAAIGRVPMLDFATINNRHGLETAVWMLPNAAFFITRRKCVRPWHNPAAGSDPTAAHVTDKKRVNETGKSIANPVVEVRGIDACNVSWFSLSGVVLM